MSCLFLRQYSIVLYRQHESTSCGGPGHTYSVVVTQLSDHEREGLVAKLIVHTRTTPPADWILRASGFVGTSTLEAYTLLESELRLQLSRIVGE